MHADPVGRRDRVPLSGGFLRAWLLKPQLCHDGGVVRYAAAVERVGQYGVEECLEAVVDEDIVDQRTFRLGNSAESGETPGRTLAFGRRVARDAAVRSL